MELTDAEREEAQAERAADRIRDELLATLQELERRRERVQRARNWLREPEVRERVAVLALFAGAAAAGAAWYLLEPSRAHRRLPPRAARVRPPRKAPPPWLGLLLRQALLAGGRAWLQSRARGRGAVPGALTAES
jgi:hypothetical protein